MNVILIITTKKCSCFCHYKLTHKSSTIKGVSRHVVWIWATFTYNIFFFMSYKLIVPGKPLQPCLMSVSRVGAYTSEALKVAPTLTQKYYTMV